MTDTERLVCGHDISGLVYACGVCEAHHRQEIKRLMRLIKAADHAPDCAIHGAGFTTTMQTCDCWKRDALAYEEGNHD